MSAQILSGFDWLILLSVSWGLAVLIWVIQLVHYPTFRYIEPSRFAEFHLHHNTSITYIVMPLMLAELANIIYLTNKTDFSSVFILLSLLVLALWAITFFVSIPAHNQMHFMKNEKAIEKLISTNWWRTALWTLKAGIVTYLFLKTV